MQHEWSKIVTINISAKLMLENHNKLCSISAVANSCQERITKNVIHGAIIYPCMEFELALKEGENGRKIAALSSLTNPPKVLLRKIQKQTVEAKHLSRRLKNWLCNPLWFNVKYTATLLARSLQFLALKQISPVLCYWPITLSWLEKGGLGSNLELVVTEKDSICSSLSNQLLTSTTNKGNTSNLI